MVRIRGDHINFGNYTLFELIESYWVDMFKSGHNRNWRYFWWKIDFRRNLIDVLSKNGLHGDQKKLIIYGKILTQQIIWIMNSILKN